MAGQGLMPHNASSRWKKQWSARPGLIDQTACCPRRGRGGAFADVIFHLRQRLADQTRRIAALVTPMLLISSAYLLWMAWRLARMTAGSHRPELVTFLDFGVMIEG